MAGRSFSRHTNGIGNRIRAEHINELQAALEEDDARIDLKTDDGQFVAHTTNKNNPHEVTKAQVGLGNVDNTSDADKPVSTAQQAALDGKAAKAAAVKAGGLTGQVLIKRSSTDYDAEWIDPPGIVYPTLLLRPEASTDRSGAVVPVITGAVTVVDGQYGKAWRHHVSGDAVRIANAGYLSRSKGTVIARARFHAPPAGQGPTQGLFYTTGSSVLRIGLARRTDSRAASYQIGNPVPGAQTGSSDSIPDGAAAVLAMTWDGAISHGYRGGVREVSQPYSEAVQGTPDTIYTTLTGFAYGHDVEALLVYPEVLPAAEIARISQLASAWTMHNAAANMTLASQPPATTGTTLLDYFKPNRKIAAGGTTLRIAPGASTTAITTLAAGTDVHSTGQTVTASSISYTLVMTSLGQGWVPTTALI